MKPHITQSELKRMLYYRRETGEFFWRFGTKNRQPWRRAGTPNVAGYLVVNLGGRNYYVHLSHRALQDGEHSSSDHKDGHRGNNRQDNLVAKTASGNGHNRKRPNRNNTQGILGVSRRGNRFRARIMIDRKEVFLGSFATEAEAIEAHRIAKSAFL